jgi:Lon protease-like protein
VASLASDIVPLFPLPNVVLFPHTMLPLHIFEARYRQMVEDALQGEKRIAVAILNASGREPDVPPPFYAVAGVGRIVRYTRLPDGRYSIALSGEARVRVEEVASERLYRKVRVQVLPEDLEWLSRRAAAGVLREVLAMGAGLGLLGDRKAPARLPREPVMRAAIVNQVASGVLAESEERQALIEADDYGVRAELLLRQLRLTERLLDTLSERGRPEDPSVN